MLLNLVVRFLVAYVDFVLQKFVEAQIELLFILLGKTHFFENRTASCVDLLKIATTIKVDTHTKS